MLFSYNICLIDSNSNNLNKPTIQHILRLQHIYTNYSYFRSVQRFQQFIFLPVRFNGSNNSYFTRSVQRFQRFIFLPVRFNGTNYSYFYPFGSTVPTIQHIPIRFNGSNNLCFYPIVLKSQLTVHD